MKRSTKIIMIAICAAVLIVCGASAWWKFYKVPHDAAVAQHNAAVKEFESKTKIIEDKNSELENAIADLRTVSESGDKPYDENVITEASTAIADAQEAEEKIPDMPQDTADIKNITEELNTDVDYSDEIASLQKAKTDFSNSIQQQKQVTAPAESFVVSRLNNVDGITQIQPVTEDNDPNGLLNKAGGYTAAVYFEASSVDQSQVYYSGNGDSIDKGTEGGGCVEVYATEDDAKSRNGYLSGFDGGILSNGSHTVVGTCVIRTSDLLTATQQKELEKKIIDALVVLE